MIEPLADHLVIPHNHIFANKLLFTEDGLCSPQSALDYLDVFLQASIEGLMRVSQPVDLEGNLLWSVRSRRDTRGELLTDEGV